MMVQAANGYNSHLSRTTKAMMDWSLLSYPGDQGASPGARSEARDMVE